MWYDWMAGGWGGRNGRDGCNVTTACFGVGLVVQPFEGQERADPGADDRARDPAPTPPAPANGAAARASQKTSVLLRGRKHGHVLHLRPRARRHLGHRGRAAVDAARPDAEAQRCGQAESFLGSVFSDVADRPGDEFARPSAGGGGFGDPLERDPDEVLEDVIDDYVSIERAAKDYGVVIEEVDPEICAYEIDAEATDRARGRIRAERLGWRATEPETVASMFREGTIDALDAVRRYAVILDWETGTLLPKTTAQFRESFEKRTASHWA